MLSKVIQFFFGHQANRLAVFLGLENHEVGGCSYYPVAKLGDYGLARKIEPMDPKNPAKYCGEGTHKYMAPVSLR